MKTKTATLLATLAALNALPTMAPPDHSQRESNRMKLTPEEVEQLATLSGREKKSYIKELRSKYK